MTRWRPERHDPVLIRYHAAGQTNEEITANMLDQGYPVARYDVNMAASRLGLVPNKPHVYREPPPPREKPNPLVTAKLWLGTRLEERATGYWLDDRPASSKELIQAANKMLAEAGCELIGPEEWR